jgi:hypothetical protein
MKKFDVLLNYPDCLIFSGSHLYFHNFIMPLLPMRMC